MTINWKAVEQYSNVLLFVFQIYPVCDFKTWYSYKALTVEVNLQEAETNSATEVEEAIMLLGDTNSDELEKP